MQQIESETWNDLIERSAKLFTVESILAMDIPDRVKYQKIKAVMNGK